MQDSANRTKWSRGAIVAIGLVLAAVGFLMGCSSIDFATTRVLVSDTFNNRVLIYDSPFLE